MFPSDDPRKKELLDLHNSHMTEYDKKLHKLANDKNGLKAEWDHTLMQYELYKVVLPQCLKRVHDLMQELGIRERKPVEEYLPHGVVKVREKTKKVKKKRKPKKSKNEAAIDLAVKIMMDKGGISEEKARKMMGKG